ncbi:MAG: hypothetical protein WC799_24075 [Desulfobacteraceae bacterium]|jgi:hypothetical protein
MEKDLSLKQIADVGVGNSSSVMMRPHFALDKRLYILIFISIFCFVFIALFDHVLVKKPPVFIKRLDTNRAEISINDSFIIRKDCVYFIFVDCINKNKIYDENKGVLKSNDHSMVYTFEINNDKEKYSYSSNGILTSRSGKNKYSTSFLISHIALSEGMYLIKFNLNNEKFKLKNIETYLRVQINRDSICL